jgi:putative transposase
VQRGVDRRPCFVLDIHYQENVRNLQASAEAEGCQVHAYVLMCNHVHLLATPLEAGGIGRLIQSISRRYVGFFNLTMERTGTLWERRYNSRQVDTDSYVLRCYRYIELNPVRAGIVRDPADFRWSSFRCNGLGMADALVTPHACYQALGNTEAERQGTYRQFTRGSEAMSDAKLVRAIGERKRGRPALKALETE